MDSKSTRKSRPSRAAPTSSPDPIAPSPVATSAPSRKRRRKDDGEGNGEIKAVVEEFTPEQQLEAWQEFAAEHYEMVEQLPLELHRNFRLLRELDDGCVAQTSKLQDQIRSYIAARQELVRRCAALTGAIAIEDVEQSEEASKPAEDEAMEVDTIESEAVVDKPAEEPNEEAGLEQQQEEISVERDKGYEVEFPAKGGEDQVDQVEDQPGGNSVAREGNQANESIVEEEEEEEEQVEMREEDKAAAPGREEIAAAVMPTEITSAEPTTATSKEPEESEIAQNNQPGTTETPVSITEHEPPPMPSLPSDMGPLVSDGEGGLVVSSSNAVDATLDPGDEVAGNGVASGTQAANQEEEAAQVTETDAVVGEGATGGSPDDRAAAAGTVDSAIVIDKLEEPATSSATQAIPRKIPAQLLPEIGRLSREIVRNCEEKVALAYGAYNSIDRHIRALDSALSAQETSLILGLRPDTLPSAGIDQTLNLAGDTSLISHNQDGDEGGMVLGLGGTVGGNRGRKQKGKKGKKVEEPVVAEEEIPALVPLPDADMEVVDPNEPTYCYCHRVSSGTMIGCDNDDCPVEWFHLPCTGLQVEPSGKWLCNLCKPKIGLGMGGAGTVQPSVIGKRANKKKKPVKR